MVIYYRHTRTIVLVLRQGSRFMPYGHWSAGYKHGNPDTTALLLLPALSAAPESPKAARTTALLKLRRAGLLPPPLWVPNLTVQSRAPSVTNGFFFSSQIHLPLTYFNIRPTHPSFTSDNQQTARKSQKAWEHDRHYKKNDHRKRLIPRFY
jgi:hypothetical protein